MSHADQDQLAAEIGMTLPENAARDEAVARHGYDPVPDIVRRVHPVFAPILTNFFTGGTMNAKS